MSLEAWAAAGCCARRGPVGSAREPTGPLQIFDSASLTRSTVRLWMAHGVWILGGYQSDFARNLSKEKRRLRSPDRRGRRGHARRGEGRTPTDIGVIHVANAFGEMFAGQGHLGAMPATVCDGLWDTPASRHEAACASGSVAALAAMADLRSGAYDSRARRRGRAGEDGARRHRRPASRRRRVDRARGCRRALSVAVDVRASRRRIRPALRPRRLTSARDRAAQLRQRAAQPQRSDPRLDGPRPDHR